MPDDPDPDPEPMPAPPATEDDELGHGALKALAIRADLEAIPYDGTTIALELAKLPDEAESSRMAREYARHRLASMPMITQPPEQS